MRLFKFLLLGYCLYTTACVYSQDRRLGIRLQNAVDITLGEEDVTLEEIDLKNLTVKTPANLNKDKLYRLKISNQLKGYAYLGSAPSKERDFDYVLLLTPGLAIQKAKVLIYRETFGREIETQRWLDQFNGLTPDSSAKFGENIDGISGATISSRSMTTAVDKALKTLKVLQNEGVL